MKQKQSRLGLAWLLPAAIMVAAAGCELVVYTDRDKIPVPTGSGGSVPSCTASEKLCEGGCLDVRFDPSNCGACGNACEADEVCSLGACALKCAGGTTKCEVDGKNRCVDTQVDGANCGACGTACTADQLCSVGACDDDCNGGTTKCVVGDKPSCFSLKNDEAHCGACDKACGVDESCIEGACKVTCFAGTTVCSVPKPGAGGAGGSPLPETMDVCVDLDLDPMHCGDCGTACASGKVCQGGQCVTDCTGGTTKCQDGNQKDICVNTAIDTSYCGDCGTACTAGKVCQAGACVTDCVGGSKKCAVGGVDKCFDMQSDSKHCGDCATACGAGEVCSLGACATTCASNLKQCKVGNKDVCIDTKNDPKNCGDCGTACASGKVCQGGACVTDCVGGTTKCEDANSNDVCVNTAIDTGYCGDCSTACASGKVCQAGACVIECVGGSTKCEVGGVDKCFDTQSDSKHCGDCGTACGAGKVCSLGACATTCAPNLKQCNVGNEDVCIDTKNDPKNCGDCGTACASGKVCQAGACVTDCVGGTTQCQDANSNDVCVDTKSDPSNCGGCGTTSSNFICSAANAKSFCAAGTCDFDCNAGFGNCDGDGSNGCEEAKTGFVVKNACGSSGTAPCIVGATGPAGGIIVFVDYRSEYADFDYLEAAASDASQVSGVVWAPKIQLANSNATLSGTGAAGGVVPAVGDRILLRYQTNTSENGIYTVNSGAWTFLNSNQTTGCYTSAGAVASCASGFAYDVSNNGGTDAYYVATAAMGMGRTNTDRLVAAEDSQGTSRSIYLAGIAKDYSTVANGVTYADWFLPSRQEAAVMVTALAAFGRLDPQYSAKYLATSSEVSTTQYARMYPFSLASTTGSKDSVVPANAGDRYRFMRRFSNESSPAQTAYACNAPAAQICGATGSSPCIVGATGPAGGTIVFVDYDQEYASFDYLEAAPTTLGPAYAPTGGRMIYPNVSVCYSAAGATGVDCAPTPTPTSTLYSSDYAAQERASTAVGMGQSNTDLMYSLFGPSGANVDGTTYWAGIVTSYTTTGPSSATYQDWFIPSLGESRIMAKALSQLGRHDASSSTAYVTSSEASTSSVWTFAPGTVSIPATTSRPSTTLFNVRPMRMFSGATGATVSFNYLNICGASGTDPCTLGATGPGGGIIVYVDTAGVYAGFDYLEAAANFETGATWRFAPSLSQGCFTASGATVNGACTSNSIYERATRTADVQAASALGMGSANTQRAYSVMSPDMGSTTTWGAYGAAAQNVALLGGKSDWFVPSSSEAAVMINYLRDAGRSVFLFTTTAYLMTSTEYEGNAGYVMTVEMNSGLLATTKTKSSTSSYLRLMRKF